MVNIIEKNWFNWIGLDFPAPLKVGRHIKRWLSFYCVLEIQCFDHVCLLHRVFFSRENVWFESAISFNNDAKITYFPFSFFIPFYMGYAHLHWQNGGNHLDENSSGAAHSVLWSFAVLYSVWWTPAEECDCSAIARNSIAPKIFPCIFL